MPETTRAERERRNSHIWVGFFGVLAIATLWAGWTVKGLPTDGMASMGRGYAGMYLCLPLVFLMVALGWAAAMKGLARAARMGAAILSLACLWTLVSLSAD